MSMIFKRFNRDYDKISANIPKELSRELDDIALFELCSKTDVINEALEEYVKHFKKKLERKKRIEENKKGTN